MHIVHIEDFFHPEAGYQLNLLTPLQIEQGNSVTIITSELLRMPKNLTSFFGEEQINYKDKEFTKNTGVKILRIPIYTNISGRSIFNLKIIKILYDINPDVLFIHDLDSFNGILFTWASFIINKPMVFDTHMVELASKNKFKKVFRVFYSYLVAPIFNIKKIPIIRVEDTDYIDKYLGIPIDQTILLSFGTDCNYFKPYLNSKILFRERYSINSDQFIILYAGKLDIYKGGLLLAEALNKKYTLNYKREIVFVVIGSSSGSYGEKVDKLLLNSENKIIRLPTMKYKDLAYYYQSVDAAIFPKQCSMSFYEMQSCGLPVILENNEINSKRLAYDNGILFESDSIESLRTAIVELANSNEYNNMSINARKVIVEHYDYSKIAYEFTKIIKNEISKYNQLNKYTII